jgi:long-chain acyl-CoA synthetase
VEEGDPGEILVRGENLFTGYWPDGADGPVGGWFATGDVAYLDATATCSSSTGARSWCWSAASTSTRARSRTSCPRTRRARGRRARGPAPVHRRDGQGARGAEPGAHASVDDLIAHCARSLARFKCPTTVEFVDELPHSATGKVSKGPLRERSA